MNIHGATVFKTAIAVFLFFHTSWAAAWNFKGEPPEFSQSLYIGDWVGSQLTHLSWRFDGFLLGIVVDLGMFWALGIIEKTQNNARRNAAYGLTIVLGVISAGMQLIYMLLHRDAKTIGANVPESLHPVAQGVVDGMIILLPIALIAVVVLVAIASRSEEVVETTTGLAIPPVYERPKEPQPVHIELDRAPEIGTPAPIQMLSLSEPEGFWYECPICGEKKGPYKTERPLKGVAASHHYQKHRVEVDA